MAKQCFKTWGKTSVDQSQKRITLLNNPCKQSLVAEGRGENLKHGRLIHTRIRISMLHDTYTMNREYKWREPAFKVLVV